MEVAQSCDYKLKYNKPSLFYTIHKINFTYIDLNEKVLTKLQRKHKRKKFYVEQKGKP